ncbi:MAG TPA: NAD-dependent epimerase/dehydratase family protein, partial [Acidimicrobiales bacterium]|nr:NAD-dependent epimerase/dehydratase family protein [Acidimicrobiales bacterium]
MSENQNSRPPPRRFLVLGANGFIGRGVAEVLVRNPASGEVVRHLHRNVGPGRGEGIRTLDLITASDADLTGLWDEVHPQVVVNCVGATAGDDVTFQELNVDLVARLVHSLGGREGTRLIQLGSAAEYGIGEPGRPVVESDRCEPVGAYGRSKLAATNLVLEAASRGDIDGTVLRVFNPIGPGAPG